ncbi:hypothetical protein OG775_32060 [Streptomyces platensis]|uniref:hypothetical protein n=1 Tax=Streptomyces platensis TaxID=58346 RepID=UPI0022512DEC|nr:hypothetical protein [Streptomyces platensis]MCX4639696.1 hypothetical protein [Streptomyces platensis]
MQAAVYLAEQNSQALPGWAPPALVGSAITACVTLLVWYLNRRREPVKRITWEARTQSSIVSIDRDFQQKVGISYGGRNVSDLCAIKVKLKNTGNKVIKDHKIRFHFPGDAEVLESHFSPEPEEELGASLLAHDTGDDSAGLLCRIAHFEVDQEVSLELLVAGNEAKNWKRPHSHNDEGDVQFREKSPEGTASDTQLVTWTLALILSLVTAPSILSVLDGLGSLMGSLVQLSLLAVTLGILPAATRALVREFRKALAGHSTTTRLYGDYSSVIYNARAVSVGSTRIHPGTPTPEDTAAV